MVNSFIVALFFLVLPLSLHAATHNPDAFIHAIKGQKNEGEQIYQHFCISCHAEKPLIPIGAPPKGLEAAWKPRLDKGKALLFQHSSEGYNAMPARGGCFECSDEQLKLAIEYMIK